jgi:hypothetical protein
MMIINVDSKFIFSKAQESYVEKIIFHSERNFSRTPHDISVILEKIPIFLTTNRDRFDYYLETVTEENPPTDYFGHYQYVKLNSGSNTPAIFIYPQKIEKVAKNEDELLDLIAMTIIYFTAIAKMEYPQSTKHLFDDEFCKMMDASFASQMVLECFENSIVGLNSFKQVSYLSSHNDRPSVIKSFNFIKNYILNQPTRFRLGQTFKELRLHSAKWTENKQTINSQVHLKNNWIQFVTKNINDFDSNHDLKEELKNKFKALY